MAQLDAHEIINEISNSKKKTSVKVYINGKLDQLSFPDEIKAFVESKTGVLFGDWSVIKPFLDQNSDFIDQIEVESNSRNSAVPLLDTKNVNARIEPGSIIRDQVAIGNNAVVMMGAIINIGSEIGDNSMIDMGVVLGGRAIVGNNSHIGAGAVLSGVIEPASAKPVQIDDNVMIGANAAILEGVHVGKGAVVGAGSIVTEDVEPNTLVVGAPAHKVRNVNEQTKSKTGLENDLRKL